MAAPVGLATYPLRVGGSPVMLGETKRVHPATVVQAAAMFVATNIDDLVVLAVFFGRARGDRSATARVVVGQYLGFIAILVVSVLGALGAQLLPDTAVSYLGLVPLLLGIRAAWLAWRHRDDDEDDWEVGGRPGVGIATVAAVTFANGGDNIGVYVPVFAVAGPSGLPGYVIVFLIGVGLWCALSQRIATHPAVARMLERWEHVLLPVVLIGIGLAVLVEGGALGL
jgi:cadmium resistance protein CadD (predicted permease)